MRTVAYADLWLRAPTPALPIPDLRHWYRRPGCQPGYKIGEPGLWLPLSCAIAYDANAAGAATNGTTSQNVAITVPGGSTALFAAVVADGSDSITGATWNSVASTSSTKFNDTSRVCYLFYWASPGSGAHNVTVTASGSVYIGVAAASYSGASVTAQPEVTATNNATNTTLTTTLTILTANAWLVLGAKTEAGTMGAGAGTTLRAHDGFGGGLTGLLDSNGPLGAGSQSLIHTGGGAAAMIGVLAALAPAGGGGGGGGKPATFYAQQVRQFRRDPSPREALLARALHDIMLRKAA